MQNTRSRPINDSLFLPDMCGIRMVFAVVMIAELAAIVIALAPMELSATDRWSKLGLISLFVQWCALSSCAVLCVLRPQLARLSNLQAGITSYLLIQLVVIIVSEAAYWFTLANHYTELGWHLKFLGRNVVISLIISGPILRYFYIQDQWQRQLKAESEARLQALQARIRPHFLFNSMNTIASLTRIQPDSAEAAIEHLSDLFRASLSEHQEAIALQQEIHLCEGYLAIEQLRLGDRLQVDWQIDNLPMDARVPPLLIQPLLENAVYHGIEPLTEGGRIQLAGSYNDQADNKLIQLEIRNPVSSDEQSRRDGHHIALQNIQARLSMFYHRDATISTELNDGYYSVKLTFPYEPEPTPEPTLKPGPSA